MKFKNSIKFKKGQLELGGALVDFWSYIILVFILIIFFGVFTIKGCNEKSTQEESLKAELASLDAHTVLLNYLRTPVEIEGKEIEMSDLIRLYKSNPDKYESILKQQSSKLSSGCYYICIDKKVMGFNDCSFRIPGCLESRQLLPYSEKDFYVELDLNPSFESYEGFA